MTTSTNNEFPRLRSLDFRPIVQDGRQMFLLRDPLGLSDKMVAVPRQLVPVLALCDGTRDRRQLPAAVAGQFQLSIDGDIVNHLIDVCDEAFLFDNERFQSARQQVLVDYRRGTCRPPALAGQSYPADPGELRELLDGYLAGVNELGDTQHTGAEQPYGAGRGLVSPHIDYGRGGPVYAAVWKRAAEMVGTADLAVVLGTDHYSERSLLTLTRQHYATPFGVLPTATGIVNALAKAMGEDTAFAGELHHRSEHSIELAAVWLHHMRGGRPIEMVPILCGGYAHFVAGDADIDSDPALNAIVDTLARSIAGRRAIVVAAGDLSHVGPAFGGEPMGLMERARLRVADKEIIDRICAGDSQGFFAAIQGMGDRNNVCGLPPIYLALRLLGKTQGEQVAYDRCPADEQNTSFVTVAGILFK